MEKRRILFDKAEVVLFVPTKNNVLTYNLVSSDFNRIQFDKCREFKFGIIPVESEKITLSASKLPSMVVYTKGKNKKLFDEYKEQLAQYAKEYRITFADNTKD